MSTVARPETIPPAVIPEQLRLPFDDPSRCPHCSSTRAVFSYDAELEEFTCSVCTYCWRPEPQR